MKYLLGLHIFFTTISNLNQPVKSSHDSDSEDNYLLIKRSGESWNKTPRKGSTDIEKSNKKSKSGDLRSADKRVSRRCMNLA